jgi:hypothetical protein
MPIAINIAIGTVRLPFNGLIKRLAAWPQVAIRASRLPITPWRTLHHRDDRLDWQTTRVHKGMARHV